MDNGDIGFMPRRYRKRVKRKYRQGTAYFCNKFQTTRGDDYTIMTNEKILMGASDYRDFFVSNFTQKRILDNLSTVTERITVRGNRKRGHKFIKDHYMSHNMFSAGTDCIVVDLGDALLELDTNSNTIDFSIHASMQRIDELKVKILNEFEEINTYIKWMYGLQGEYTNIPLDTTLIPVDEMYPFLNGETLEEYYQRYLDSSASILILIGPPGTGKTSFIRGYLCATQSSAIVTYDEKILSTDSIFSELIDRDSNALVIEDADLFLSSRKDGGDMMHKFLNVGDGLVTVKGKKIIFSTNLPSISSIDDALLRPGRCFDVLDFTPLNLEEAKLCVARLGIDFKFKGNPHDTYTIAELFTGVRNSGKKSPKSNFGFS